MLSVYPVGGIGNPRRLRLSPPLSNISLRSVACYAITFLLPFFFLEQKLLTIEDKNQNPSLNIFHSIFENQSQRFSTRNSSELRGGTRALLNPSRTSRQSGEKGRERKERRVDRDRRIYPRKRVNVCAGARISIQGQDRISSANYTRGGCPHRGLTLGALR